MKLEYMVVVAGEPGAGIRGFTDEVTIELKDGSPDWETTQDMTAHFRQAIAGWYDGGRVWTKAEFDAQQELIDRQMEGHP